MKYSKSFCLFFLLAISSVLASQCEIDDCYLYKGLSVDGNGNLYYPSFCDGQAKIKKVSVNGGVVSDAYSYQSTPSGGIDSLLAQSGDYLFFSGPRQLINNAWGHLLKAVQLSTSQVFDITSVLPTGASPKTMDVEGSTSYVCYQLNGEFLISRFNGLIGVNPVSETLLFNLGDSECLTIRAQENSDFLYVVTTINDGYADQLAFWRGSKTCNGLNDCGGLNIFTSSPGNVVTAWTDADVSNNVLYYSSINHYSWQPFIRGINFTTNSVTFTTISSNSHAKGIHVNNNRLYLSIQSSIYSVNVDGSDMVQIPLYKSCDN